MDRLSALDQSIYAEIELCLLFNSFAVAFYQLPQVQAFWESLARSEGTHVIMLESEKWRMAREELDAARVRYNDPSLLRQMKKFDELRAAVIHPPDLRQTLSIALKAEEMALAFHEDRIFIADFGVSDQVIQSIVEMEERHREILEQLLASPDPEAAIPGIDLSPFGEMPVV